MRIKQLFTRVQKFIIFSFFPKKRIHFLRKQGVKIGENCNIETSMFSTEPYLIEIGNHVGISSGTSFITHDGAASWCFRKELNGGVFGKIKIGNDVAIGQSCIILPNTTIGNNSIIGAGSVVRGQFPDNSVIMGNPGKVVMRMSAQRLLYKNNPGLCKTLTLNLPDTVKLLKEHFQVD